MPGAGVPAGAYCLGWWQRLSCRMLYSTTLLFVPGALQPAIQQASANLEITMGFQVSCSFPPASSRCLLERRLPPGGHAPQRPAQRRALHRYARRCGLWRGDCRSARLAAKARSALCR